MSGSIPLSLLARQLALLGERFKTRYPHPWLVWEPTATTRAADVKQADVGTTQSPQGAVRLRPVGVDPMCFAVGPDKQVTVGRSSSNEIVIDDMTMSREHFLLFLEGDTWHLALKEPVTCATFVRKISVQSGKPVFLVDGCSIQAGDVELKFYEGASMLERLEADLKKQESR